MDITDDTTGKVHSLAREHTPPYVNEVGHNKKLHSNVLIRDKNDRAVYYYVGIDEEHAMKKGDTVELFVNYGDHYEQVRERKGYGLVNMADHVGGDEEDGARLHRNFHEREEMEKDVSSLKVYEMFHLAEFLNEKIFVPINKSIQMAYPEDGSAKAENANTIRYRDLIARRRLHWIGEKLSGRVQEFIDDPNVIISEFVTSIRASLRQWRFVSMPNVFNQLSPDLKKVLIGELAEECLYQTRSQLPSPLDETVWSQLAVDLTRKTSAALAQYLFCYSGPFNIRKQFLGQDLLKLAKKFAETVREGCKAINIMEGNTIPEGAVDEHIDQLSFKSPQRKIKKKNLFDESKGKMMSLYDNENTVRFGTAAAMADIQAYYDAVELCGIESYYIPGKTKRVSECGRSIVSLYSEQNSINNNTDKHSPQFNWMARTVDAFKRGDARVNEQWYLENQVLLVVHLLASTCVDWGGHSDGNNWYSFEKLCEAMNFDQTKANRVISQGAINPTWPKPEIIPAYSPALSDEGFISGRAHRKARPRTNPSSSKRELFSGPDDDFPGWTVKKIQRGGSNHVDKYWSRPELPGITVRSRVGVKALMDYMEANDVGAREAYEANQGQTKFFLTRVLH